MEGKGIDQSGLRIFQQCYKMCCKSENIIPLKNLTLKNSGHALDFCVDRIKYSDWAPIFISLSDDLSLHCLAIRCRSQVKTVLEQVDCERMAKNVSRSPVILTKFMLSNLVESISQCVSQTPVLSMLQVEGLPLYFPYIEPIALALGMNHSLKHISFHGCLIGDLGCQKVCTALRAAHNVITLNLSGCNLTAQGAVNVADLIKFLKIYRYSENWKQTLRYQNPDLDSMPGLRRVTLSDNPEFGDNGLLHLIEVLLDDLWVKAVDLQQCGLTETVVKNCLQLLEFNATLRVLDVRYNTTISMKSIGNIAIALKKNENNTTFDQTWLTVSSTSLIHRDQKLPPKNKSYQKKEKPPLQVNLGHSFGLRNDENRSMNELVHLNIIKEQLKQETAHRRQLEELNERLLQQVKELKQQQITQWKTCNYQDPNDTKCVGSNKSKQMYTINLSDNATHTVKPKPNKQACCHHKNRIGDSVDNNVSHNIMKNTSDSTVSEASDAFLMGDLNTRELRHKIFTGADILEKLLEHRYNSRNGSRADDGDVCNNDFSSDSSSTENTVRRNDLDNAIGDENN